MTLTLQPIRVATGFDEEGMMALDEEQRLKQHLTKLPLVSANISFE